jgi:hypothetical protein
MLAAVIGATLAGPSLSQSQLKETKIPAGTEVLVGTPAKIPPGLLDSFRSHLSKNKEVRAAYLGLVYYKREGENPHLALVVRMDRTSTLTTDSIREELGAASSGF